MYLMIDNYDSFVYNLACYLRECDKQVSLVRNDRISADQILTLAADGSLEGIILSPGPKSPEDCGNCKEIITKMAGRVPILGVCLGHQIIGSVFGATIEKGAHPVHGKVHEITNNQQGLFQGLPASYNVTRYHSLVVSDTAFPSCLQVDARTKDGVIMALHHKHLPIYGVQFHPEAVLTEHGHALLKNFTIICEEWNKTHGN